MPTLPTATTSINESASPYASATGYIVVMGCVNQSADFVPRVFSSTQGLLAQYNYAPAVDYCSMHFNEANTPVIFVGLPIATQGLIGSYDNTGVTGTSAITVTAGTGGPMDKVSGVLTVQQGTTVGTDQIILLLSCDGGQSTQIVRLGTATTYAIPNLNLTLNFGAGTLNQGDVFRFNTTAPMWGSTAITSARTALAAQQRLARSWLVVGGVPTSTFANYVLTELNNYQSANERFVYGRVQIADLSPLAKKSMVNVKMTGGPSITFAASGHTITRATGSFVTDGFAIGQVVTVAGSTSNNGVIGALTAVSATVLTFGSGVVNEGPDATGVTISASEGLTFAASGETITRSTGSWLNDGFAVGQNVTVTGSTSNNVTSIAVSAVSSTVLTLASGLANEGPIASSGVTIVQSETLSAYVNAEAAAFASIAGQSAIDLGIGHGYKQSPITGWLFRRPFQWAASLREYQHDLQIPTYEKDLGPLDGWSLTDANGNIVEYDERTVGGALAGLFSCFRTYANGPLGAFVALSLTRDNDNAFLSRTHNRAVANLACTVVQSETENAIGTVLVLNADGTATAASLSLLEKKVNRALQVNLLQNFKEGQRASSAVWTANPGDILSSPGSTLNGSMALVLNGTLENITTVVRVS